MMLVQVTPAMGCYPQVNTYHCERCKVGLTDAAEELPVDPVRRLSIDPHRFGSKGRESS